MSIKVERAGSNHSIEKICDRHWYAYYILATPFENLERHNFFQSCVELIENYLLKPQAWLGFGMYARTKVKLMNIV